MEELVKKELVTPSPDTTTSSRLVVLKAHIASSSSSRTSSDSEKEIKKARKPVSRFRGKKALPTNPDYPNQKQAPRFATPNNPFQMDIQYRGKESSKVFHRKRIASKYYRKQRLKNADDFYKKDQTSIPRASGKCFKYGKRGHFITKCNSKTRNLTSTIDSKPHEDIDSTSAPKVQIPKGETQVQIYKVSKPDPRLVPLATHLGKTQLLIRMTATVEKSIPHRIRIWKHQKNPKMNHQLTPTKGSWSSRKNSPQIQQPQAKNLTQKRIESREKPTEPTIPQIKRKKFWQNGKNS